MGQMKAGTAPRSLREKQRQEREELILKVAEEMLMEKGYYETSIDEIAARVGIAKGTVYLHFPKKEDLVIAIFLCEVQGVLSTVDEIINTEASARSRIEAILQHMYGRVQMQRMHLLSSMFNSADWHYVWKEHREKIDELWEQMAEKVGNVLEQGKAAGEFDADLPTPLMLAAFFSLLSPKSYERLLMKTGMRGDELANYLGRIYFKGITASGKEAK